MFHTPRRSLAICFRGNLRVVGFIRKEVDMLQTVTSDATFGPGPTFTTDVGFDIALSPDKKAFTATIQRPRGHHRRQIGAADRDTRLLVLHPADSTPSPDRKFRSSFRALPSPKRGRTLTCVFTRQRPVVDCLSAEPSRTRASSISSNTRLRTRLRPKSPYFLLANRDSKSDAAVHLNVTAIDTDIAKH